MDMLSLTHTQAHTSRHNSVYYAVMALSDSLGHPPLPKCILLGQSFRFDHAQLQEDLDKGESKETQTEEKGSEIRRTRMESQHIAVMFGSSRLMMWAFRHPPVRNER